MIQAEVTEVTVDEIARQLKATYEGAGDLDITGAATLESAGPCEIAFVGNRKAAAQAAQATGKSPASLFRPGEVVPETKPG